MFSINWILGLLPTWVPWAIVIIGIALFFLEKVAVFLVPVFYRLPIKILAVLLFAFGFYIEGRQDVIVKEEAKIKQVISDQNDITKKAVEDYKKQLSKVSEKNVQISKTITKTDDHMCVVPQSFVSLHNDAVKNSVSDPATRVDGAASGIELSTAEEVIVENYGLYHKVADQLKALQKWVSDQKALNP
jgi:hypothetical protein